MRGGAASASSIAGRRSGRAGVATHLRSCPAVDRRCSQARCRLLEPHRQVPALHLRPRPVRRGRRTGLQEPPRSRTRVPRPQVDHRAAPGVPPPRTSHPRPRPALLARAATHPRCRTPHRHDLATHRPRAGPATRDHPVWASRDRGPNHRTQHRPGGHSLGLRAHPATPDHHPRPQLSCANTPTPRPHERGHTPTPSPRAHSRRSCPRFDPHVYLRTAEPGVRRRDLSQGHRTLGVPVPAGDRPVRTGSSTFSPHRSGILPRPDGSSPGH